MSRSLRSDWFPRAARPKSVQHHRRMLRIEPLEDRRLLAAVIGIDFGGSGEVIAANQTAGVVPRANWNNAAIGHLGTVNDLVNDANNQTTADVSWTANNTWQISAAAPADGNAAIYKGYLDTTAVSTTTVVVSQIPYAYYDVYIYFDGDTAVGRSGKYTIDTSTLAPITQGEYLDNANWPISAGGGAFALADAPGEAGNYLLFSGLSGQSFALTATPFGGVNPRAPVNAIQIVERLVVDTNTDIDDGNYGAGQLSLREAIALANARSGADTITFAAGMSGQTILLGGSQLTITEALTIDAAPLAQNVTINAQQQSRIFNLTNTSGDVTLAGLTLTGGRTTADFDNGGGIRSTSSGLLTLNESTVSGNSTAGVNSWGGGIYASGNVTLTESTVSGNSTAGVSSRGGGIYANASVTLTHSTVSGNSTAGNSSGGGGIRTFGSVTLTESTVSGNSTAGNSSWGGGIYATLGNVTLTQSTVSGNSTTGLGSRSGGIAAYGNVSLTQSTVSGNTSSGSGGGIIAANVMLTQSTVSGNTSGGDGGGVIARFAATITQSTITNNQAAGAGGGLDQYNLSSNYPVTISGSIIAGNTANGGSPDLRPDPGSVVNVNYSLIGTSVIPTSGANNISTDNPLLGPLGNNGGPTQTHALLPGSPAIDAGDPAINSGVDQRGFARVEDSDDNGSVRIDIGAYELSSPLIVVDTNTDIDDGNYGAGQLSLREAIALANARPGAETITFAGSMSGQTILLGGSQLTITGAVTIDAAPLAQNVTINAQQQSRIFNITATTGDFTLAGLTLTGGRTTAGSDPGGAIRSQSPGLLTLSESTVSGNSTTGIGSQGGGIRTIGSVTLIESTVSGNSTAGNSSGGGGISTFGSVTLTQSTVSNNSTTGSSSDGGGIRASGSVTLTQSTVSGNSTAGSGAWGGGIFAANVMLTQSTVSGNSSNSIGGGIFANGNVTLTQSTVTNNQSVGAGGGLFQSNYSSNAPVTISGSIIAGNTAAGGSADLRPDPDSAVTVNYSLIGTSVIPTSGANNISTDNPLLGPLGNNGGPTQTHALLPGSPAIDAGDPAINSGFDQRGLARVADGDGNGSVRIDIGAYEVPAPLVVDTNTDIDDGNYGAGQFSLREAIALANARPGSETITFAGSMSGQTILLGGSQLTITGAVTIDAAPLAQNVTINAQQQSRIFNITATTGDFTLAGLTLTGGRTTGIFDGGGAIRSQSSGLVTLSESTISGNSTAGSNASGGGIFFASGNVTLTHSTVSGNSSKGVGGGIYALNVTLTQSTVSGNSSGAGGGIFAFNVTLTQSTVSGNSSGAGGGGIYAANVTLTQSTITNNHSVGAGGGLGQPNHFSNAPVTISGSIIAGNTAAGGSPDLRPDPDSVVTVNYSLIGVASGLTFTGNVGNLTGTTASPLNPQLGPLGNNGGPTQTHALLPGSPAIDAVGLLDSFSSNRFATHYNFVDAFSSADNNPQVSGGAAHLNVGTGTGAFIWNQGQKLSAVGDRVSVDFGFNYPIAAGGFALSSAGLALFGSVSGDMLAELRVETDKVNGNSTLRLSSGIGETPLTGTPSGLMTLSVVVTGTSPTARTVQYTLSGNGIANITGSRTFNRTEIYFGPVAFDVVGDDSVHDDLVFAAAGGAVFDQRGLPRPVNGGNGLRPDIGAYELQVFPAGDYNQDVIVNAADYVLWRDNFTAFGGNPTGYNTWRQNFGNTTVPVTPPGSGAGAEFESATGSASAESAAIPSDFTPTTFTSSLSRQSSSVALNQTPITPADKRMLLAFDQALEELDEERTDSRWLADADDEEDETESEYALAAALVELW